MVTGVRNLLTEWNMVFGVVVVERKGRSKLVFRLPVLLGRAGKGGNFTVLRAACVGDFCGQRQPENGLVLYFQAALGGLFCAARLRRASLGSACSGR